MFGIQVAWMTPGPASVTVEMAGIPNCRAATRAYSVQPMCLVNAPQFQGCITSYPQIQTLMCVDFSVISCHFISALVFGISMFRPGLDSGFAPRHKGQESIVEDDVRRGHHLVEGFQQFGQDTPSRSSPTESWSIWQFILCSLGCYVCGSSPSQVINVYNICACDMFWKNIVAQEWGHHWCAAALNSTSLAQDQVCLFVKFILRSKARISATSSLTERSSCWFRRWF